MSLVCYGGHLLFHKPSDLLAMLFHRSGVEHDYLVWELAGWAQGESNSDDDFKMDLIKRIAICHKNIHFLEHSRAIFRWSLLPLSYCPATILQYLWKISGMIQGLGGFGFTAWLFLLLWWIKKLELKMKTFTGNFSISAPGEPVRLHLPPSPPNPCKWIALRIIDRHSLGQL